MLELKREVTRATYAGFGEEPLSDWQERFCSKVYFSERVGSEDSAFFIVGDPLRPVGMGALKTRDGRAYFGDLYVRAPGRGIGRRLFAARLALARQWGLSEGVCDVFSNNQRALDFVHRNGFREADGYRERSLGIWVHRLARPIDPEPPREPPGLRTPAA